MLTTYYLGLGSNLGDRLGYLAAAVRALEATPGVVVLGGSRIYESAPLGRTDQPDFLNLVVALRAPLLPPDLLSRCLAIESALGRVRTLRWGPRTIDLDLLLAEGLVWSDAQLTVPHPRIRERNFVLLPLAELAPAYRLDGETIAAHAARLDPAGLHAFAIWPDLLTRSRASP